MPRVEKQLKFQKRKLYCLRTFHTSVGDTSIAVLEETAGVVIGLAEYEGNILFIVDMGEDGQIGITETELDTYWTFVQ